MNTYLKARATFPQSGVAMIGTYTMNEPGKIHDVFSTDGGESWFVGYGFPIARQFVLLVSDPETVVVPGLWTSVWRRLIGINRF